SSALFSNSTLPLDASTRIAVGASPSKPPSSFFGAPCTLLLAAYTIPPQPTASATTAAIRPRHGTMAAASDLRETEVTAAIGDVLNPCVLTVGSSSNNTGFGLAFRTCRRVGRIAAPDEGTYRGDAAISRQDTKNRAETRCLPHAPFPP